MPDIDSTLRLIAQGKHIISTDLTSAFYQIPLSRDSMKYCGVATPFRGVRVYARSVMGIPGSETALEELMSRVLGDLLKDGIVTKIADDLYCSGNSPGELLSNWKKVLQALHKRDLRLSPHKTIINPQSTTILGWVWNSGTSSASPHRIAALASFRTPGIGATLYVTRNDKLRLAGFFSAKLRGSQLTWLPCEVEALAIAVATKHFSPYLIQSHHKACILTDSTKPCVQAYEELCRGKFSASPHVSTFLSTVSRYEASVRHVSGSAKLPADFASRNAAPCEDEACQVCTFTRLTQDSVTRRTSIQDILSSNGHLPFTSRTAWLATQSECPDLRRTHAHLLQGTRPSKKLTNMKDVKRCLNVTTIAKDDLHVVKRNEPLAPTRECIVVPR